MAEPEAAPSRTGGDPQAATPSASPYERIRYTDWDPGDPYDGLPRFYVEYGWRRNPCREIVLYEGEPGGYKSEMEGVKYKDEAGGPLKRLGRFAFRLRFNIGDRRQQRRERRARYDSK